MAPASVVSDSDSELSDIEDALPAIKPANDRPHDASNDASSDTLSEHPDGASDGSDEQEDSNDEDDSASSLSELSSDEEEEHGTSTTPSTRQNSRAAPSAQQGRGSPRKRKAEDPGSSVNRALDSRRSLRRHGLPPDAATIDFEQQPLPRKQKRNAPTSAADLNVRRTRSGATISTARRSASTPETPKRSRTRSGRVAPHALAPSPLRQQPSSNSTVEVAIGPSLVRKSDFSPGGNPDDYIAKPSPAKRRRTSVPGAIEGGVSVDGSPAGGKKKRRKPKNRGWGRSGSVKNPKAEGSSSAPRSRKRLYRSDPALDYLTEVFSLNDNPEEEFHFNGDALSVPFPFTFNPNGNAGAEDQGPESSQAARDGSEDQSGEVIEMPLQGPLSVIEASSKTPLPIPASWIPPPPPQAIRHMERLARGERRKQQALALLALKAEEEQGKQEVPEAATESGGVQAEDIQMTEAAAGNVEQEAVDFAALSAAEGAVSALDILSTQAALQQNADEQPAAAPQAEVTAPSAGASCDTITVDPLRTAMPSSSSEAAPQVEDTPVLAGPSEEKSTATTADCSKIAMTLSPLEPESDESDNESDDGISPLRPSSFYPTPGGSGGFPGIPIFTPTMSQFKDFYSLCKRIDAWGMRTGIVKIIPPKEWTESLPDLNTEIEVEGSPASQILQKIAEQHKAASEGMAVVGPEAPAASVEAKDLDVEAQKDVKDEAFVPEASVALESDPNALETTTAPVVPPPTAPVPPLRTIRIRNTIRQVILPVGSGAYSQTNLTVPNKVWNAKQWADICASDAQRGPELDRMKRKIESLKAGADALNVHGLSGHRRRPKDSTAAEDLDEMLKETEGVRTRSGRKHRTAREEEADDEDEDGNEDEQEEEEEAADRSAELQLSKQPRAVPSNAAPVHSPPRSEHGNNVAEKSGTEATAEEHVLTPPASHANDGSDRSDHQAGSPPAAPSVHKEDATNEDAADMDVDSQMPALEEVGTMSQSASPAKAAPKKVSMPDRTTPAEWRAFDYKTCWLKEAVDLDEDAEEHAASSSTAPSAKALPKSTEWTIDVCREIEGEYWRNLTMGKPAMYGADLPGTLFKPDMNVWNVGKLDNLLTRMRFRRKLRGVTTPYLYFGMWRATFAWHLEDMDLYSINYIHFGAPKQWYAIPQTERKRFETAMASAFPTDARKCPHFMRHKSYLVSPRYLARHNIKPLKLVQHAGEFVITYPYGYHSGYNLGFNCAESVNFALDTWVEIGRNAGYCKCRTDSVQMDVEAFLEEALMEEKARADKEREDLEKKERARLKKLQSAAAKGKARATEDADGAPKPAKAKKVKREGTLADVAEAQEGQADDESAAAGKKAKPKGYPCIFCVSMIEDDMVPVPPSATPSPKFAQEPVGPASMASADGTQPAPASEEADVSMDSKGLGSKTKAATAPVPRFAHRLCANILPETWVYRDVEVVKTRKRVRRSSAPGHSEPRDAFSPHLGTQSGAVAVVPSSDDEDGELHAPPGAVLPRRVPSSDAGDDEAPILVDNAEGPARYGADADYETVEEEEEIVKEEEVRGFENIEKARWALKCSLCPTNQLAKVGCKVQCTRAKCSRAAHVTCANLADSGWYVAIVNKAEADKLEFGGLRSKKGAKKGKPKPGAAKDAPAGGVTASEPAAGPSAPAANGDLSMAASEAPSAADATMDIDAADADADPDATGVDGGHKAELDADERLVLLCKAHNPEAKKAEATRKALLLREQCMALEPMSLINVRAGSNSGVWQVLLLEVFDVPGGEAAVRAGAAPTSKGEVVVMYDGQRHRVKWGRIEFGTGTGGKAAVAAGPAAAAAPDAGSVTGATPGAGPSAAPGPSSAATAQTGFEAQSVAGTMSAPESQPQANQQPQTQPQTVQQTLPPLATVTGTLHPAFAPPSSHRPREVAPPALPTTAGPNAYGAAPPTRAQGPVHPAFHPPSSSYTHGGPVGPNYGHDSVGTYSAGPSLPQGIAGSAAPAPAHGHYVSGGMPPSGFYSAPAASGSGPGPVDAHYGATPALAHGGHASYQAPSHQPVHVLGGAGYEYHQVTGYPGQPSYGLPQAQHHPAAPNSSHVQPVYYQQQQQQPPQQHPYRHQHQPQHQHQYQDQQHSAAQIPHAGAAGMMPVPQTQASYAGPHGNAAGPGYPGAGVGAYPRHL